MELRAAEVPHRCQPAIWGKLSGFCGGFGNAPFVARQDCQPSYNLANGAGADERQKWASNDRGDRARLRADLSQFRLHQPVVDRRGDYAPPMARFSKRVYSRMKASFTMPVGPLRCLATISSATPSLSAAGCVLSLYMSSR